MAINSDVLNSLVPITQFNKGQASRIFDRLRTERHLIVLKNNVPTAVILSPEEYERLCSIEENYRTLQGKNTPGPSAPAASQDAGGADPE